MVLETEQHQVKLFGKWSYEGVECKDISLVVSTHHSCDAHFIASLSSRIILNLAGVSICLILRVAMQASAFAKLNALLSNVLQTHL
jgi:hypothetical protein